MPALVDFTGMCFGFLDADSIAEKLNGRTAYNCTCRRCGNKCVVEARHLKSGRTISCGCYGLLLRTQASTTHGLSRTRAYKSWRCMKNRCYDEKHPSYSNYGGAGKVVCEHWLDPQNFCADMGEPPPGMQVDREENWQGYWCGHCEQCLGNGWYANCRWATHGENQRNKDNNRIVIVDGQSMAATAAAELYGIKVRTFFWRLNHGWSDHEAALTPVGAGRNSSP